jgi:hypothetical protein
MGEKGVDRSHFIPDIIGRLLSHLCAGPVDPLFPLGGEAGGDWLPGFLVSEVYYDTQGLSPDAVWIS